MIDGPRLIWVRCSRCWLTGRGKPPANCGTCGDTAEVLYDGPASGAPAEILAFIRLFDGGTKTVN